MKCFCCDLESTKFLFDLNYEDNTNAESPIVGLCDEHYPDMREDLPNTLYQDISFEEVVIIEIMNS